MMHYSNILLQHLLTFPGTQLIGQKTTPKGTIYFIELYGVAHLCYVAGVEKNKEYHLQVISREIGIPDSIDELIKKGGFHG